MENNSFYNWNLNIRPDSFQMDAAGFLGGDSLAVGLASKGQIRHQAFTIGFFGFHYIRAANENEPTLQGESLQILRDFVIASNFDINFRKDLVAAENRSYSNYWKNVLKPISLELGDSQGLEIQRTVEFGYWLAAAYSCFVGLLEENDTREIAGCLKILKAWMSDLLVLARQAEISGQLYGRLIESNDLLRRSKNRSTAYKCTQLLKLILKDLLLLGKGWG